ncbi:MAG: DUF3868 domain-containing protein [Porphyromonadaceae bacterium]|nr:DUF3868 domain-containing protein [Porphyromonadaceae bacterium]
MKTFTNILIASLLISANVVAQGNYSSEISVENQLIKKSGQELDISMNINISKLDINSQHMITLTPVLISSDNKDTKELPPVVISGNTRSKVLKRTLQLNGKPEFSQQPFAMIHRINTETQVIEYKTTVPYIQWMKKGKLVINQEITGCALCGLGKEERLLASPVLKEEFKPSYVVNYITPEVEAIKMRNEILEIYLNYKVGSYVVLPTFDNNEAELEKVASTLRNIKNNSDITLTNIKITGFASPEGIYLNNMKLSENRAKSLAAHLQKSHSLEKGLFILDWKGEDWDGLVKALESYTIEDKEKVLDIIKSTDVMDGRERRIMELNSGKTYQTILQDLFPPLRRNTCVVNFTVKQFTIDKAKEQIKTNPKLLSLNEMYQVAYSYEKGSQARNEAFAIAAQTFPESPVAIANAAAVLIEKGQPTEAMKNMEKMKDQPEVWNNLGVALAQSGKYTEAKEYFIKAADKGLSEASENLDQLNKLLEDL